MDQMLLKCEDIESVLVLLTTHRGVFFVHNLVTAMQLLGSLGQETTDPMLVNEVLRDPRYDLLMRDLLRFVPQLDFGAMASVACALWQLDHKHYTLLTRMLQPLLHDPPPDVETVLRCAQAYAWAGYSSQHGFFTHCGVVLAEAAPDMAPAQLLEAVELFGRVTQCSDRFFAAAKRELLEERSLLASGEISPQGTAVVASAFSAHLRTEHDDLYAVLAAQLEVHASEMAIGDIAACLAAFRRVALRFEGATVACLAAAAGPLSRAWLLRRRVEGVQARHVATLLEASAFFGVAHPELTGMALDYLDGLVDEVTEQSAIDVVYAMSALGMTGTHPMLLTYLLRKIGRGSAWEKHRLRVFHLWICQQLQFPWVDVRVPRRCVNVGLRAWLHHRGGFGAPFPHEVRDVAAELEAMGVEHRTFVDVPDSPYEVDIALHRSKSALLVVSEVARNDPSRPVGGLLLQIRHLEARGWRAALLARSRWLELLSEPPEARQAFLRELIEPLGPW